MTSLASIDKNKDMVFLCEVFEEATYVKHHPKKIAFIFSAMRHFAAFLRQKGYQVHYVGYQDPKNTGSFEQELQRIVTAHAISEVHLTHPGEWRVLEKFKSVKKSVSAPIIIHEDKRFLCAIDTFKTWAKGKKQLRMEYFYRMMRQKYQILMDPNNNPIGGNWNYDTNNRKNANHLKDFPHRLEHVIDDITADVLALVEQEFSSHFGQLYPFHFAVTRKQALEEAQYFIGHCLIYFGDYQDAMLVNEASLYHSRLSYYLNVGLLLPLELCQMAEAAYHHQQLPLNSVEGFIRQILGWREYVRGIYWLNMPDYAHTNYFKASKPLPAMYWGDDTHMFCMKEVIRQTKVEAYSHHIQRLMITGNFALLSGLEPKAVCDWYLAVYADAYEWVELPNTLGMALYADGGLMASKPYAASGKYIQRMSNFCQKCAYDPKEIVGDTACPFNALYWNFLHKNESRLNKNPRLNYAYAAWKKMASSKKKAIIAHAENILSRLHALVHHRDNDI